jgi:lipoprotein-releasing system permease protein
MRSMPFEVRIGLRYTRAGRGSARHNPFISFISGVSMIGIALGVMALIVVLSVMNGFVSQVRDRMLAVISHIEVVASGRALPNWRAAEATVRRHPAVLGVAPYVNGQALSISGDSVRAVLVRGIDPAAEVTVSDIGTQAQGAQLSALTAGQYGIVLGGALAQALGLSIGEKLTLVAPQGQGGINSVPRRAQFTLIGTFDSGHFQYDSTLGLINIDDAAQFFGGNRLAGLRLKLSDMHSAPEVARQLSQVIGEQFLVRDWTQQNRQWFGAVQVQKRMMFIILALIVAVAAFNLVATLVMTVTEKQSDIAILRTLGASPASVMAVFMVQGVLIGVVGTMLGVAGGLLLAHNLDIVFPLIERLGGTSLVRKDIYFIDSLPSEARAGDIVPIALISVALSLLATLYPSWRASRVRPAEALRYD